MKKDGAGGTGPVLIPGILAFLGMLCAVYGLVVKSVGSGTLFFAVWLVLGVFFCILALLVRMRIWHRMPGALRVVIVVLAVVLLAVFLFTEARIASAFHERGEPDLDYIVVLGAQIYESGPSAVLKYRLDEACRYLRENPETICIVSGAKGYNEPYTEAEGMKKYLTEQGIPEERILEERRAKNTVENIQYSMELFDPETDRVGIVTNDFHLYRGVAIAEKEGIRNISGIAAGSVPMYLPNNMLREFLGVMKDRLQGNIQWE